MSARWREYLAPEEVQVVLYHANCYDGSASAFAAQHYFKTVKNSDVKCIALSHGDAVPVDEIAGKNVLIADFSFKRPVMERDLVTAKRVLVLDHHVSAKNDLADLPGCFFEMEMSGASMSWRYFFDPVPVPRLIRAIQDRDIWAWEHEESRPLTAALYSLVEANYENLV